jgi:hypothetical protein
VSVGVWVILCRQLSRADEDQCMECQAEHENEGLLLEDIGRLLGDVRASARFAMQAALTWLTLALTPLRHLLSSHIRACARELQRWHLAGSGSAERTSRWCTSRRCCLAASSGLCHDFLSFQASS